MASLEPQDYKNEIALAEARASQRSAALAALESGSRPEEIERAMHYAVFVAPNAPSVSLAGHCTEFELLGLLEPSAARTGGES